MKEGTGSVPPYHPCAFGRINVLSVPELSHSGEAEVAG